MRKAKNKFAKLGALAVATVMVAGVGMTSLAAFAATENEGGKTYTSFLDVVKAEEELNKEIAAEGVVLLKNNNKTLPLAANTKVSLLGGNAYSAQTGGGGSGALSTPYGVDAEKNPATTLRAGLTGLVVNEKVEKLYGAGSSANGENRTYMTLLETGTGVVEFGGKQYNAAGDKNFLKDVESSYKTDGDVAIISVMRAGSEFVDNQAHSVANHADDTEHYYTLNDNERQLFAYAKDQKAKGNLSKIIVVINSPSAMELGDLEDDDAIGAILQIGASGWNGMDIMGDILTGKVNPSGKTVDFWMRDIKTDPTYYNLSDYSGANYQINGSFYHKDSHGGTPSSKGVDNAPLMGHTSDTGYANVSNRVIDYAEGIFMGYRYYETVAADMNAAKAGSGDTWYEDVTLYPFGHGLSYTTFTQEIKSVTGDLTDKDGNITVTVTVTNTGDVAGKEVVQLYNTPPYNPGGIDKAAVNLVGFAKTKVLEAKATEDVAITIAVKDLASFDWNDANDNKHSGYELETGKYVLSVRNGSHEELDSEELTAATLFNYEEDEDNDTPNNIYSQTSGAWEMYNTDANHWTVEDISGHQLTRGTLLNTAKDAPSDLKNLSWLLTDKNVFKDEAFNVLNYRAATVAGGADEDNAATVTKETNYDNVWNKTAADMEGKTQGTGVADKETGLYAITVADMYGEAYDSEKWDQLLNQLTWAEMVSFVSSGSFRTEALPTIGKIKKTDGDGPQQTKSNGQNGWAWVGTTTVASTWNTEICEELGAMVGIEEQWNDGSGWYGPAMNTHRSMLSGRNFEYYSQDGIQGGKIAAAVVRGCVENGGRVYIKHAFLNDQETNRGGLATFCNEQAIREIYAKVFELAIREGKANGIMTAFNLIGLTSSASYATNVQLYTNEWGYRGATVTDMWSAASSGWNGYGMVRGLQMPLGTNVGRGTDIEGTWDAEAGVVKVGGKASYTQWYWTRELAHRILYVHVNSAAYNGGFLNAKAFLGVKTSIEGSAGVDSVNAVVVNKAYLDEFYGGAENYKVTVTGLPEGLTFDEDTFTVSGTPTASTRHEETTVNKGRPTTRLYDYVEATVEVRGTVSDVAYTQDIGGVTTIRYTFLSQADKDIDALKERVTALENQIKDLESALADIEGLYEDLDAVKATIETLQNTISQLNTTIEQLNTKIAELETKIEEVEKQPGPEGPAGPAGPAGPKGDKGDKGDAGSGCGGVIGIGSVSAAAVVILGAYLVLRRRNSAK